ncbi:MAG: 4-vinyl reductase [Candidatus Methanomethylicia archaeon]|nr:4-vinyl reductase [Candidatus Methanomethylicia archaeon]
MSSPLDIKRFLVCPGRKIVGITGRLKIDVETILQVASIFAKHKIVIRHFVTSAIDGNEGETYSVMFLDITDSDAKLEEVIAELNKSGTFRVLKTINPLADGLIADTASYPIKVGAKRAAIFTEAEYKGLLTEVRKLFGTGGDTLLYHVGFHTGMRLGRFHKEIAEKAGITGPDKIFKQISTKMFQLSGYGRMEVIELEKDRAVIQVCDSFECELGKGRVTPCSHFIRGVVAGMLSEIFEKGFTVVEEACIAKGDPVCRFEAWVK